MSEVQIRRSDVDNSDEQVFDDALLRTRLHEASTLEALDQIDREIQPLSEPFKGLLQAMSHKRRQAIEEQLRSTLLQAANEISDTIDTLLTPETPPPAFRDPYQDYSEHPYGEPEEAAPAYEEGDDDDVGHIDVQAIDFSKGDRHHVNFQHLDKRALEAEEEQPPFVVSEVLKDQEPIGKGSIAEAFRVRHPQYKSIIIKRGKPGDEEYFLRAEQALTRLEGETGIPQLLQLEEQHDNIPYLAYKDVLGSRKLYDDIQHGKVVFQKAFRELPREEKEAFVEALAQVLARVHDKDLIHNDLGLDHVLMHPHIHLDATQPGVAVQWRPLLIDFAFARLTDDAEAGSEGFHSLRSLPTHHGKPRYHTPDLVEGYDRDQQWEVEVFAWIACELLTGEIPSRGNMRELLEEAHVNDVLKEKLVAASHKRSERYANMVEFVENPFSRCANDIMPFVGSQIESGEIDEEAMEFLRNDYIQEALQEELRYDATEDLDEQQRKLSLLATIFQALREEPGKRDRFIQLYHEYLDTEDPDLLVFVFRSLEMRIDQHQRHSEETDARALYTHARERLFARSPYSPDPVRISSAEYFTLAAKEEDPQLAFNPDIIYEERAFYWTCVEILSLEENVAAHIFSQNLHNLTAVDFMEHQKWITRFLRDAPETVSLPLLEHFRKNNATLSEDAELLSEERAARDAVNAVLQSTLHHYVMQSRRSPRYHHEINEDFFPALLESLENDRWDHQLAQEMTPVCRNAPDQEALNLMEQKASRESPHLPRHERLQNYFLGPESGTVPPATQIDWILELWEDPEIEIKRPQEEQAPDARLRGVHSRLQQLPPTAFSRSQIARMARLAFPHTEREGAEMSHFGDSSLPALLIEEPLLMKLTEIERNPNTRTHDVAASAVLDVLKELEDRLAPYWFVSTAMYDELSTLHDRLRGVYPHNRDGEYREISKRLQRFEILLEQKSRLWYFMILLAWLRQCFVDQHN